MKLKRSIYQVRVTAFVERLSYSPDRRNLLLQVLPGGEAYVQVNKKFDTSEPEPDNVIIYGVRSESERTYVNINQNSIDVVYIVNSGLSIDLSRLDEYVTILFRKLIDVIDKLETQVYRIAIAPSIRTEYYLTNRLVGIQPQLTAASFDGAVPRSYNFAMSYEAQRKLGKDDVGLYYVVQTAEDMNAEEVVDNKAYKLCEFDINTIPCDAPLSREVIDAFYINASSLSIEFINFVLGNEENS